MSENRKLTDAEIEELEWDSKWLHQVASPAIDALQKEVKKLRARIKELESIIAELEQQDERE